RTGRAGTDAPHEVEAVDPGRVAVAPLDVERVVANDPRGENLDVGVHMLLEDHPLPRGLAHALRAGAAAPEISRRIDALVSVAPADRDPLAALLPDRKRGGRVRREGGHATPPRP